MESMTWLLIIYGKRTVKYQSPSLVMLAEGRIFCNVAGTFPENDGRTEKDEEIKWIKPCHHSENLTGTFLIL